MWWPFAVWGALFAIAFLSGCSLLGEREVIVREQEFLVCPEVKPQARGIEWPAGADLLAVRQGWAEMRDGLDAWADAWDSCVERLP